MSPLNSVPFFEKTQYIKKNHYSNFCTFEIAKKCSTGQRFICTEVTSYKIHILVQLMSPDIIFKETRYMGDFSKYIVALSENQDFIVLLSWLPSSPEVRGKKRLRAYISASYMNHFLNNMIDSGFQDFCRNSTKFVLFRYQFVIMFGNLPG